jgi:transposase
MCLFLMLINGCTTTKIVTEYKERLVIPPSAFLVSCVPPFTKPPLTYGEAVLRDPAWLKSWRLCASQIEHLREYFGYNSGE